MEETLQVPPATTVLAAKLTNPLLRDGTNVIFIAGGSDAGKQTTLNLMLAIRPDSWWFSVQYTTRDPLPGEIDGLHYHFRDRSRFQQLVDANAFTEYAEVHGNWYGTPLQPIYDRLDIGKIVICDANVQSIARLKLIFPKAAFFFLFKQPEELRFHLRNRGDISGDDIDLRIRNATQEFEAATSLFEPSYLVPSKTVLDEAGIPTRDGIEDIIAEIRRMTYIHAQNHWQKTEQLADLL